MGRWGKTALHIIVAGVSFIGAYEIAVWARLDWWLNPENARPVLQLALLYAAIAGIVELALGVEKSSWRFSSLRDAILISRSAAITALSFLAIYFVVARAIGLPRSTFVLACLFHILLLVGLRIVARLRADRSLLHVVFSRRQSFGPNSDRERLLIVGEPLRADAFLRDIETDRSALFFPVGILSPKAGDAGEIRAVPVIGATTDFDAELQALAARGLSPEAILFLSDPLQLPGVTAERLGKLSSDGVKLLRRPAVTDALGADGSVAVTQITLEELLSRPPVELDELPVRAFLSGKRVLVTGAAGSIGSELCRQIAANGCEAITLLDCSESGLFGIAAELRQRFPSLTLAEVLCDIREGARLTAWFEKARPDVVFHAAALKHVPMLEQHPCEAVHTNVFGTSNVLKAARHARAGNLVLISTDKAVAPASVMGATKRMAEALARASCRDSVTNVSVVRFGNVLGSSGSVVPTFRQQIESGGPVTVTHEAVERYFMTIPEAVQLVLFASANTADGAQRDPAARLFVLEMGAPVRIVDLARQMITLMGKRPDVDVEISFTGLRPGEKLQEELVDDEEIAIERWESIREIINNTDHARFREAWLRELEQAAMANDAVRVRRALFAAVQALREVVVPAAG